MRLDKYLKVSRIIKRRTIAKEICDSERVKINGAVAKAGTEVSVNDVIEIRFGEKISRYRVLQIREHVPQDQAANLYETL